MYEFTVTVVRTCIGWDLSSFLFKIGEGLWEIDGYWGKGSHCCNALPTYSPKAGSDRQL